MISLAGLPALLVALAVFAWCAGKVRLPGLLEALEKLGSLGVSGEDLKAREKRLQSLGVPLSAELFSAGKLAFTLLPVLTGLLLLFDRHPAGVLIISATPLIRRSPEIFLGLMEKKRKEEILRDFPLMVDQVKIYARAAGYYNALKIMCKSLEKGTLGRELAVLSAEMELMGVIEAINNFAARCGIPEISDFARIIVVEQTTGADISRVLADYSGIARQRQVSGIKRRIKIQPILMSILPGTLLIIFMLMFIMPLVGGIIGQINAIR